MMPIYVWLCLLMICITLAGAAGYYAGRYDERKLFPTDAKPEVNPQGFEKTMKKKARSRYDFGNQLDPVMPEGTLRAPIKEEKEVGDEEDRQ